MRALSKTSLSLTLGLVFLVGASTNVRSAPVPNPYFFPTGNAQFDLDPNRLRDSNVAILVDTPRTGGDPLSDVAQQQSLTNLGRLNGWNYKDVRIAYNPATDEAGVGVNFFKNANGSPINIAGDADGDGDPGRTSQEAKDLGGVDLPNFSGSEALAIALDTNLDGTPDVIAGIPSNKTGSGIDAFSVSSYKNPGLAGIDSAFGNKLDQHMGNIAYNPSKDHPDFEFTIKNFSKLPGLSVGSGQRFQFTLRAYAGSIDDVVAGEDLFSTPVSISAVPVPEPTTLAGWTLASVAAFFMVRSRRRA